MKKLATNFKEILRKDIKDIYVRIISMVVFGWFISTLFSHPIIDLILIIIGVITFIDISEKISTSTEQNEYHKEIREIQEERRIIIEKLEHDKSAINLTQLNLSQLSEYYTINKSQARKSFNFSVLVVFLGFATVIASIIFSFFQTGQKTELSIVTGISGVLLQFIGGANFVVYNKTVEQSNNFHTQLIRIQNVMLAIELCTQVKDPDKNFKLTEKIVTSLIEKDTVDQKESPKNRHSKLTHLRKNVLESDSESNEDT
jgi:hypothetical protein